MTNEALREKAKSLTPYITAILDLAERIKGTNNGYLFAPKGDEITLAKENPSIFIYTFNPSNSLFPHKIELKYKS